MNNCLLTGATGIVGSHILFEWLRKSFVSNSNTHIFLVVRDSKFSAKNRVQQILSDPSRPDFIKPYTLEQCLKHISIISSDVSSLTLKHLENLNFQNVIHCAGSTNLTPNNETKKEVYFQNFDVTKHLLSILPRKVTRFLFVSTAFSFGIQDKKVKEEMINFSASDFRNPYENSKYDTEVLVKEECKTKGISSQILRPSIVCGRLIEAPLFETPKFDVFYAWAIFLSKYAQKADRTFRIWINKTSGLNIVPVDFVAKVILHAFDTPSLKELNIINPQKILHEIFVEKVLHKFGITTFEYVSEKPENLTLFEQLYYKSIGNVFEKYITLPDLNFDNELISKIISELKLDACLGVSKNFMNLIDFSVEKEFRKSYL